MPTGSLRHQSPRTALRPRGNNPRTIKIVVNVDAVEHDLFLEEAEIDELALAAWVRQVAIERAIQNRMRRREQSVAL